MTTAWWRHQMETFSALLTICAGNSPVPGEFSAQRSVTRSFDVFFDLRLNKRLSKQSWGWWSETLSRPLWRHCNGNVHFFHASTILTWCHGSTWDSDTSCSHKTVTITTICIMSLAVYNATVSAGYLDSESVSGGIWSSVDNRSWFNKPKHNTCASQS